MWICKAIVLSYKASGLDMRGPQIESFDLYDWVTRYSGRIKHNLTSSSIKSPLLKEMGISVDYDEFQRNRSSYKGSFRSVLANAFDVREINVLVTCSGSEALFLAIGSTIGPGDEVVVTTPNYAPTFQIPKLLGGNVKLVRSKFEERFQPEIDSLRAAVSSKTRLVMLTNSNNPSGCMISANLLKEIFEDAGDAVVVVDEAFREYGFQKAPPIAATLSNNCLSVGTMSKFYGAEDLRIGWMIGNEQLIERAKRLKDWVTMENSAFSEMLACKIFEERAKFVDRAREFYDGNIVLVENWMRNRKELSWVKPDCGLICFPKYNLPIGSVELAQNLALENHVAVGPGAFFNYEGYFRLCFTQTHKEVSEALTALGNGLDSIAEQRDHNKTF
jgi:aspartate/methionine/tyrosine aminotransferase